MKKQNNAKELAKENVTRHDITRHCEERSDEAIHLIDCRVGLRCACPPRNDEYCNGNPPTPTLPAMQAGLQGLQARLFPLLLRWGGNLDGNSGTPQSLINSNHFTHLTHLTHFKKAAFTLAEVLVTLAVIGIVAAMTIPNLVQSYKKKEVETKLVKFYSMMNNAIKLAEVDYGPQSSWSDYYESDEVDGDGNFLYQKGDKYDAHVKKYFAPYLKITGSKEMRDKNIAYGPQKIYYLSDGSAFGFCLHENRELFFYTEDPEKCVNKDNPVNTCLFVFAFIPYNGYFLSSYEHNFSNGIQPSLYKWNGTKESLVSGCKDNMYGYCVELIRQNGWKIPDDYPFKF